MAGSGEFSRTGNTRALNANLGSAITGGTICPGADLIGTITTAIAGGAVTQTALTLSGGISKAIPDDCVVIACSATGAVDTMESFTVNGAMAVAATTVTIDSCTVNKARSNGDLLYCLAFKPYLALFLSTGAPTDNTLGTEYSQTGYARQLLPWTAPTAADPPVAANQSSTTFGPLTGANGTDIVAYCAMRDSLTGPTGAVAANMYAWWTFATTRTPNSGDSINIAAAALTMQSFH